MLMHISLQIPYSKIDQKQKIKYVYYISYNVKIFDLYPFIVEIMNHLL